MSHPDHAPTSASEAAATGYQLRQEGRAHVDGYGRLSDLAVRAEALLEREEAIAGAAAGFEPRRSNEDERNWTLVRSRLSTDATNRMVQMVDRAVAAGIDGLEGESFEFVGDLRMFVALVRASEKTAEKRLRLHERESQHQTTVTAWSRSEYEQTMKGQV